MTRLAKEAANSIYVLAITMHTVWYSVDVSGIIDAYE